MGFHEKHRVATWLGEGGLDFSRGKYRLLFKCELDLGPGHTEETLFTVGPDETGEWVLLCRETEWSNEGYSVVAGVPAGAFAAVAGIHVRASGCGCSTSGEAVRPPLVWRSEMPA